MANDSMQMMIIATVTVNTSANTFIVKNGNKEAQINNTIKTLTVNIT